MTDITLGLVFALIGLFVMIGSALDWRIVTHSGKLLNRILGDRLARGIYMLVGAVFFALGIGQFFGMNWIGK